LGIPESVFSDEDPTFVRIEQYNPCQAPVIGPARTSAEPEAFPLGGVNIEGAAGGSISFPADPATVLTIDMPFALPEGASVRLRRPVTDVDSLSVGQWQSLGTAELNEARTQATFPIRSGGIYWVFVSGSITVASPTAAQTQAFSFPPVNEFPQGYTPALEHELIFEGEVDASFLGCALESVRFQQADGLQRFAVPPGTQYGLVLTRIGRQPNRPGTAGVPVTFSVTGGADVDPVTQTGLWTYWTCQTQPITAVDQEDADEHVQGHLQGGGTGG